MKAADHLKDISRPKGRGEHVAFRMIICLAVLRAPMFGAFLRAGEECIEPIPWVRVSRLEPWQSGLPFQTTSNVRFYDVVHENHLPTYMSELINDAQSIGKRVEDAADVIVSGKGITDIDDEATYRTLRALNSEDELPDDPEPLHRIARIASNFPLP